MGYNSSELELQLHTVGGYAKQMPLITNAEVDFF
jgi:hypothetical protein